MTGLNLTSAYMYFNKIGDWLDSHFVNKGQCGEFVHYFKFIFYDLFIKYMGTSI